MSRVNNSKTFLFYTDLGTVQVNRQEVEEYDVEDVIADKAASQAEILKLEIVAANIDVNADKLPRQISASAYLG